MAFIKDREQAFILDDHLPLGLALGAVKGDAGIRVGGAVGALPRPDGRAGGPATAGLGMMGLRVGLAIGFTPYDLDRGLNIVPV